MECITKNNKQVLVAYINDCGENLGGYYVQIYDDGFNDIIDDFCIHREDCDCRDVNDVERYIKEYIKDLML